MSVLAFLSYHYSAEAVLSGLAKTPGTRPGAPLLPTCIRRSGILQIGSRLLAALGHDFIGEALALVERAHAGAFHRADMNKHVARAVARRDESESLLGVEELDSAGGHGGFPCVMKLPCCDALKALFASSDRNIRFLG